MKIVGIIPARFKSTRFPGKPLVPILGKPMVIHVAEIVSKALGKENTYVATDSDEIARIDKKWDYNVVMTGDDALTGTDRVWQAAQQISADIYINIQGDEPLLNPEDIRTIGSEKEKNMNFVINGMHKIAADEDPNSINIPKVVATEKNLLIYISRLPVPGFKSKNLRPLMYMKQIGMYAFTRDELEKFGTFGKKSYIESTEDIEVLRFFDLAIPVHMVELSGSSLAVDVPEDVIKVEDAMRKMGRK